MPGDVLERVELGGIARVVEAEFGVPSITKAGDQVAEKGLVVVVAEPSAARSCFSVEEIHAAAEAGRISTERAADSPRYACVRYGSTSGR